MSIEGIASEGENKSFQHIIRCKVRVFGTWMSYGEHRPWSGRTRKQCLFVLGEQRWGSFGGISSQTGFRCHWRVGLLR